MRIRPLLSIGVLCLPAFGCAECFLDSLVNLYPQGYTDTAGPIEQKQADLNQRIEANKELGKFGN